MRLQEKMQEVKNEQKKRGYDLDLQSYPLSMMILHWKIPLSFIFDVLLQSAFSFNISVVRTVLSFIFEILSSIFFSLKI